VDGHSSGLVIEAGVEGRLTAARLIRRELDGDTCTFEEVDDSFTDGRCERIYETGDKQLRHRCDVTRLLLVRRWFEHGEHDTVRIECLRQGADARDG